MLLVVLEPVVVLLLGVTEPLVRAVFGRGAFDARAVEMTSTAISWFALALLGVAVVEVCSRSFYALGDTRTPVALAVLGMVINVIGDLVLGRLFGVAGIAAATTASFLVVATGQTVALHVRHRAVHLGELMRRVLRCATAAGTAGGATWSLVAALPVSDGELQGDVILLAVAGSGSIAVYVATLAVLRGPELREVGAIVARLRRRTARVDASTR